MIGKAGLRFKSAPLNGSSSSLQNFESLTAEEFLYGPWSKDSQRVLVTTQSELGFLP